MLLSLGVDAAPFVSKTNFHVITDIFILVLYKYMYSTANITLTSDVKYIYMHNSYQIKESN